MSGSKTISEERRSGAMRALDALGAHRSDHQQLRIQCGHVHHLAAVYSTPAGLVYTSRTGPHGHGSKDFIDTGRGGSRGGAEYVDMLGADPGVGDSLPAWCDCGPRTLSRAELLGYVRAGEGSVRMA